MAIGFGELLYFLIFFKQTYLGAGPDLCFTYFNLLDVLHWIPF
jgi:hypothetical protein